MRAFEIDELMRRRAESGQIWLEFMRTASLSVGLYELAAGSSDPQQPHSEDEVYYVLRGRGQIRVDGEDRPVQRGSVIYVDRHVGHRFHSIEADLSVLVFFAPPAGSLRT